MPSQVHPRQVPDLPFPLQDDNLRVLREGIFDDSTVSVLVDQDYTFATLSPTPLFNYESYKPRSQRLELQAYKKSLDVLVRRFRKISDAIPEEGRLLEVGAAEGSFLALLAVERPQLKLNAVEPDGDTAAARQLLKLEGDFVSLSMARAAGVRADVVCLFHVFEHIAKPGEFIGELKSVLAPHGRIIIEVPSLSDPLLTLYKSKAYEHFYFQRQHPIVYSAASLRRVLDGNDLKVLEMRPYQRYGLENHIGWLRHGRPGGDADVASLVAGIDAAYRAELEARGVTDTIFAIVQAA